MPMIESARGISAAEETAAACPRVRRLSFGGVDYTLDLDLEWTHEERELDYARARLAHASRLAGIEPPIDTVVPGAGSRALPPVERNARRMGFRGSVSFIPISLRPVTRSSRRTTRRSREPGDPRGFRRRAGGRLGRNAPRWPVI
ncbi:MAG: hypothetical protein IPI06_09550 [Gammaproteobacteria bacterium]|nr:hypothetical protein [Gammaproteobacteria bacterium]